MSHVDTKARMVGLYGGSFDPIHLGHLILARDACEQLGLDQVIFLPARISPHKLDNPPTSASTRLAMVRAAVDGTKEFLVDDRELRREGPSYAIDTVKELRSEQPATRFYFFVGEDNLTALPTWRDFDSLEKLVEFVALSRTGPDSSRELQTIPRQIEISSTEIRKRVAEGLSISYMVPESVLSIIDSNRLYRDV